MDPEKKTPESRTGNKHEVGGEFFTCFFVVFSLLQSSMVSLFFFLEAKQSQ